MIVSKILKELGVTDFSLSGEPTNGNEFNSMFKKAVGVDEHETAIMSSDPKKFGVTWSQVEEKINATQYQRDRISQYPSIQDQLDMQYHDQVNGTTTWKDSIAKVKSDNPKP